MGLYKRFLPHISYHEKYLFLLLLDSYRSERAGTGHKGISIYQDVSSRTSNSKDRISQLKGTL